MKRSGFLRRGKRLLSVSAKRRASGLGRRDDLVYRAVDARAGGRCEVVLEGLRCPRPAREHHHTRKPRSTYHAPEWIVAVCLPCHARCDAPMVQGKLVAFPLGAGLFCFRVVVKPSEFHADPESAA